MDHEKESSIAKVKTAHFNRTKKGFIPYIPSPDVCLVNSRKGKYQHMHQLLGKTKAITINVFPSPFYSAFFPGHGALWYRLYHWPVEVSCQLSQLHLLTDSYQAPNSSFKEGNVWGQTDRVGKRNSLDAVQALLIHSQHLSLCYQQSPVQNTSSCRLGCYEDNELHHSQTPYLSKGQIYITSVPSGWHKNNWHKACKYRYILRHY